MISLGNHETPALGCDGLIDRSIKESTSLAINSFQVGSYHSLLTGCP